MTPGQNLAGLIFLALALFGLGFWAEAALLRSGAPVFAIGAIVMVAVIIAICRPFGRALDAVEAQL